MIVDIVQKISLIVLNTSDLGGGSDPYQRVLRSPKRQDDTKRENEDKARSPSTDQVKCTSFSIRIMYILSFPLSTPQIRLERPLRIFLYLERLAFLLSPSANIILHCMIIKCLHNLTPTVMQKNHVYTKNIMV